MAKQSVWVRGLTRTAPLFGFIAAFGACSAEAPQGPGEGDFTPEVDQLSQTLRSSGHHWNWSDHSLFCGGPQARECGSERVCVKIHSRSCEPDGHYGICLPKPRYCPPISNPMCGCDGVTYENFCSAAQAGVTVDHRGECEPPPMEDPMCGGSMDKKCPGFGQCVDAPDKCEERDCTGICLCRTEEKCEEGLVFDSDPFVCDCVRDDSSSNP